MSAGRGDGEETTATDHLVAAGPAGRGPEGGGVAGLAQGRLSEGDVLVAVGTAAALKAGRAAWPKAGHGRTPSQ